MEQRKYGNGSIYRRQDGRWVAAVCSCDPVTGKSIRHDRYGKPNRKRCRKKWSCSSRANILPSPKA